MVSPECEFMGRFFDHDLEADDQVMNALLISAEKESHFRGEDFTAMTNPGGWNEVQEATQEIQKICDQMKTFAEEKLQKTFDVFNAKSFAAQIVQGKNYIVKAHVGGDEFIHLKVFESLHSEGGKLKLCDLQYPKTKDEPLIPF